MGEAILELESEPEVIDTESVISPDTLTVTDAQNQDTGLVLSQSDAFAAVEHREKLFERIKCLAIQATDQKDWHKMGDSESLYLKSTGAEKIARRFGISVTNVTQEVIAMQDANNKPYNLFISKGTISTGKERIEVMGTSSEKDKFIKKTADLYKKAYTNMYANGISRFLGLRSISQKELEEITNKKHNINQTHFKSNSNPHNTEPSSQNNTANLPRIFEIRDNKKTNTPYLILYKSFPLSDKEKEKLGFFKSERTGFYGRVNDDPHIYQKIKNIAQKVNSKKGNSQ